jgi:hypothetical protein
VSRFVGNGVQLSLDIGVRGRQEEEKEQVAWDGSCSITAKQQCKSPRASTTGSPGTLVPERAQRRGRQQRMGTPGPDPGKKDHNPSASDIRNEVQEQDYQRWTVMAVLRGKT